MGYNDFVTKYKKKLTFDVFMVYAKANIPGFNENNKSSTPSDL